MHIKKRLLVANVFRDFIWNVSIYNAYVSAEGVVEKLWVFG